MLITPGDVVIDADGTYPLEPGDYSAVGRVGGEVVTDAVPFTIEACPTDGSDGSPDRGSDSRLLRPVASVVPRARLAAPRPGPRCRRPTRSVIAATAPGSDAWRLVLLALAGTLAAALLLTPARSVRKDR